MPKTSNAGTTNSERTFVRVFWGDRRVGRYRQTLKKVVAAGKERFQPKPLAVYCFGESNAQWLRQLGRDPRVLSPSCVVNWLNQRRRLAWGQRQYGVSMWVHKLAALCVALQHHSDIVYLDWDTRQTRPLPEDFWDRLRQGQPIQATLRQFFRPYCHWRSTDQRKLSYGAFIYCRDTEIMQRAFGLYKGLAPMAPSDEVVLSWLIDDMAGGWKGPKHYQTMGFEPYCFQCTKQVLRPETDLFRSCP